MRNFIFCAVIKMSRQKYLEYTLSAKIDPNFRLELEIFTYRNVNISLINLAILRKFFKKYDK